ncbi:hypothetical protein BDK51DRAFT_52087 [Blyttiomyces helicus]|uniref:Uncharacterized protein n=1 Tax=Blyttiomyces helicus TaxID=388810 RepID=A0A4P9W3C9_9FUNG|nr:hypothetical protein BDK51DRAFT_52087 [Blyttiomyces helicus]|eukprot:RKO86819.1 hypothetical protein BDK51DRAFT_52087 [Blyttiomyces helicus]
MNKITVARFHGPFAGSSAHGRSAEGGTPPTPFRSGYGGHAPALPPPLKAANPSHHSGILAGGLTGLRYHPPPPDLHSSPPNQRTEGLKPPPPGHEPGMLPLHQVPRQPQLAPIQQAVTGNPPVLLSADLSQCPARFTTDHRTANHRRPCRSPHATVHRAQCPLASPPYPEEGAHTRRPGTHTRDWSERVENTLGAYAITPQQPPTRIQGMGWFPDSFMSDVPLVVGGDPTNGIQLQLTVNLNNPSNIHLIINDAVTFDMTFNGGVVGSVHFANIDIPVGASQPAQSTFFHPASDAASQTAGAGLLSGFTMGQQDMVVTITNGRTGKGTAPSLRIPMPMPHHYHPLHIAMERRSDRGFGMFLPSWATTTDVPFAHHRCFLCTITSLMLGTPIQSTLPGKSVSHCKPSPPPPAADLVKEPHLG